MTCFRYLKALGPAMMGSLAQAQYIPADAVLHNRIAQLDSIFFDAYNRCETQLEVYANFYADDLEFYHDRGGLTQSKKEVVDGTAKHICGKVTRHLKPDSLEVYPINGWGAIEMGVHYFKNKEAPAATPRESRFIIFWRQDKDAWRISKVVSLH